MKQFLIFSLVLFCSYSLDAQTRYDVSSGAEFIEAQNLATTGDSIVWKEGTYLDTRMDLDKDGIIVTAEQYGTVLFTGVSRVVINANEVTFSGFQYIGGFIGNLDVIRVYGSDVLISHINIQNYTSFKYLRVYEESRRTTISHCNFENRLNLDNQNILSILVDDEPGYHKIQYCSFKNFEGVGLDQGIEPIRIGVSTQGDLDSRTLVEYCYFTQCNGDGEIISHKSRQNVYRYNTFENNPVSELVLRHGDEGIVYGNFFINNMGGIRVREGSDHFIYNNYFEGLDKRVIYLMNDPVDPLDEIHIYHNTIVNSEEVRLGGIGNNPPTNVTIANNIFTSPTEKLFQEDTGNETWLGNLSFGNLGIDFPSVGLMDLDPQLSENIEGFFQPEPTSPIISAASDGYPSVPLYPQMDYDNEISFDLMKETRPLVVSDRAIGASEFSTTSIVQPHATEMNTGPSYLFDNLVNYIAVNASQLYIGKDGDTRSVMISSNIDWTVTTSLNWISTDLSSGSGDAQLNIAIDANPENVNRSGTVIISDGTKSATIIIYQDPGELSGVLVNYETEMLLFPNPTAGRIILTNLPSEIYRSVIGIMDVDGKSVFTKEYFVDQKELVIDLDKLIAGTYLLNIQFISHNDSILSTSTRKIVKN